MSRDIRGLDLLIAITVAVSVVLIAGVALSAPALEKGEAPDIDIGLGLPIAVTPILDTPQGSPGSKGGGKPRTRRVPKSWQRRAPPKPADLPPPPPGAEPLPPPDAPPADPATPRALPHLPKPPPPTDPDAPNDPLPSVDDQPAPADAPPQDPAAPEGDGEGEGEGGGDGPPGLPDAEGEGPAGGDDAGDLVAQKAIAAYRQRLIRWLSARFRVTGSGLSKAELLKYKVRATIKIGDDRTVTGFSIKPSGSAAFDKAAKEALQSVVGEQVPPPPDDYPGALQSTVKTTFVCKESTCN